MKPAWKPDLPEQDRPTSAEVSGSKRQRVRTVKAGEPVTAILLNAPEGFRMHWIEAQRVSRPCSGERCGQCAAGLPCQWTYFVAAVVWEKDPITESESWPQCVLLLTEAAAKSLSDRACRGAMIDFHRESGRRNNPLQAVVREEGLDRLPAAGDQVGKPLPEPEDVQAVLHHIWGMQPSKESQPRRDVLPGPWVQSDRSA